MDLLDSNILLQYVRANPPALIIEARYALTSSDPVPLISGVSEGELRTLALQMAWGSAKQERMKELFGYFTIIPLPFSTIIDAYAEIDDYSRRQGISMGKNDVWIAATAAVTGARLLTTDKDFDHLHSVFLERDWIDPASL